MLDDEDRVAEVAQTLERADELRVVALVQANRRLVEDVEHADERRPDLRRETDPLGLAAGQGRGRTIHREVADADVLEEAQTLLDLAQDQPRDVTFGLGQLDLREPLDRTARRQRTELVDRRTRDEHRERLRPKPRAVARRAWPDAHELLDPLALVLGVGLAVAALEVRNDPLEARRVVALAPEAVAVANLDGLAVGAVEEDLALLGAERAPRLLDVDPVALGQRRRHLLVVAGARAGPRRERTLSDRQLAVGHDELGVDLQLRSRGPCSARRRPAAR